MWQSYCCMAELKYLHHDFAALELLVLHLSQYFAD